MNDTSYPAPALRASRITTQGGAVTLRSAGQGRPIVLCHSLLADGSSFDRIAGALARSHHVVILDLPGFGGSDRVDGGLEAVADRVAAVIGELGLSEPPVLLGNGFGGFVVLAAAIRHPGIASRLVLADCGAAFSEPGRAAFRGMSAGAAAHGLAGIADVAMRRLFSPAYQAQHPALVQERRERFLAIDLQTFHNACAALASLDLRPALASVTTPVLVLVGELDEATPPPMSTELAAGLPDARLQVLPGCAHVPQLQAPELFMEAIADFITQR